MNQDATIPDNKTNNIEQYILEPLSVIIKLAIITIKPPETKLFIYDNIVCFNEKGMFQGISRFYNKSNKSDLAFLNVPVYLACCKYLTRDMIEKFPSMRTLFEMARSGLEILKTTYRHNDMACIVLHYLTCIISSHLVSKKHASSDDIFYSGRMRPMYTDSLLEQYRKIWTDDRLLIFLNIACFLSIDHDANRNVAAFETFMVTIDLEAQNCIRV